MRHLLMPLALSAVLLASGCGGKQFWNAGTAQGGGVQVQPMQSWVSGHKLWVRTTVLNGTTDPIVVVRDAISCALPNGAMVGRASGSTTVHTPYVIPAGGAHAVYVEFEEGDFDWHTVPQVTVDFSKAITKNGQPVGVSPMQIVNAGP